MNELRLPSFLVAQSLELHSQARISFLWLGDLLGSFPRIHVSEDKTYLKNSCWSVEIVFTLKKRGVGNFLSILLLIYST